jgi:aromatic ring-cleaving dioxygenase
MPVDDYLPERGAEWEEARHSPVEFFTILYKDGYIDGDLYKSEQARLGNLNRMSVDELTPLEKQYLGLPVKSEEITPENQGFIEPKTAGGAAGAVEGKLASYFKDAFTEVLRSFWQWLKDVFGDLFQSVWDWLKPKLEQFWDWTKANLESAGRSIYDYISKALDSVGVLTPEKAPGLALQLYLFAMSAGVGAHFTSVMTELVHPVKNLGVGQLAGLIGDFAGFGRISAATIGVLESRILGQAMTYAFQNKHRPVIPMDRELTDLAASEHIDLDRFREAMSYHGYSESWINAIQDGMYREPSYRELSLLAEDESATDEWLRSKIRMARYRPEDVAMFVTSLHKRLNRSYRTNYYTHAFNMYKEGFIDKERFSNMLTWLELRPEAVSFAIASADLAGLYDYAKDAVTYYTNEYLKDIISQEELLVSLVSLGVTSKKAALMVRLAKVKKTPKPAKPVRKEIEPAMTALQTKYVTLYREQYKKGLINENLFLADLLSVGINQDLAEVTVAIEEAKKSSPS